MSEEEYDLFCTHCGMRISKDTQYCPSCGMAISGQNEVQNGNVSSRNEALERTLDSRLRFLAILFTITAVYYVVSGIFDLLTIDSSIDALKDSGFWDFIVDYFDNIGMNEQETEDYLRTMSLVTAICNIVVGALVGVSAFCSFSRKHWMAGLVCGILATIVSSMTIIGLIIGVIAVCLYSTTKPCFSS